jgi:DNA-binding protein YbaB
MFKNLTNFASAMKNLTQLGPQVRAMQLKLESAKSTLEHLTKDAMNQANRAAKELHIQAIRDLTGGAEIFPGFNDMLKNIAG